MEFHEYSNFLPLMQGEDFESLVEDIRENGLLHAITLYDGKIIDGRNRYLACEKANVEPRYEERNDLDPISIVISNETRRHTTSAQKAIVAARVWQDVLAPRAKQAQVEALARGRESRGATTESEIPITPEPVQSSRALTASRQAAKMFQVDEENVRLADKILKTCAVLAEVSPEIGRYWEKVRDNELSLADAKQQLHAFSVHYEVDTEFVKAGAAKLEREQKAEEAKKARALEKELERQRLAQDTERKQQAAAERAEKEAQELQERTQKALQQTENEKEWARVAAEAIEAEKAVQEALKEEQQIIAVEQEQKQKAMELRQSAMDEALKAEAKIRRAQDSAFNKASLHLQTADSYLIPAIKLITETKLTATQLDSLGVLYDNLYKNLDLLNGVLGEETETTF